MTTGAGAGPTSRAIGDLRAGALVTPPVADASPGRLPPAVGASLASFVISRLLVAVPVVVWGRGGIPGLWRVWDGSWFVGIADNGYPEGFLAPGDHRSPWAFLPLYPALVRAVQAVGVPTGAAALVANLALGAALAVVLAVLAAEVVSPGAAAWGCALFWFFPGSAVLSFAYSEPLFLLLVCVGLLALLKERWALAGLATALACATRAAGVALLLACVVAAVVTLVRRHATPAPGGRFAAAAPLAAPVLGSLGLIGVGAYARIHSGDWLIWRRAQEGWDQQIDFGVRMPGSARYEMFGGGGNGVTWVVTLVSGAVLLAAVLLLAVRRARLPLALAVYTAATAVILLSSTNVMTKPRFVLTLVPLFPAVAAQLGRTSRRVVVVALAVLLPVTTYLYLALQHVIP